MGQLFVKRRPVRAGWLVLVIAAGFLAGLGAAYFCFSPGVLSHSPQSGRLAGGYTALEVEFTVPMDPACTEGRVSLRPDVAVRMEWRNATLRILPVDPWPAGRTIQLTVQEGACSARGLPLRAPSSWSFTATGPRIAYIRHAEDAYLLMAADSDGNESAELLRSEEPIRDYAVSARGEFIVYSTGLSAAPGDLWLLPLDGRAPEPLLPCGGDSCRNPAISPDGSLVAFERSPMDPSRSGGPVPLRPRVEYLRLDDRTVTQASPDDHIADNPVWSPAGWLSYYDSTDHLIVVDDLHGGRTYVPDTTGDSWTWLPDGKQVVLTEMTLVERSVGGTEQPVDIYSNLYLVTLSGNARANISGDPELVDSSPAISPDGRRLAFTRDYRDSRWTPGRQLWLMDLGDRSASPITNLPGYGHSALDWSPDGTELAFMRYHETAPLDPPEVWRIDSNGQNAVRVAVGGYLPQWLP
jgi:dipeptidyl aminopeptidase/acylaminoacyl peptidase